jgi:hypothetical protein
VKLYAKFQNDDWQCVGTASADQNAFEYRAPQDGSYAFLFVLVDRNGKNYPSSLARAVPQRLVVVDTVPPEVRLTPIHAANGDICLQASIVDANPDYASLKLSYKAADGSWKNLENATADSPQLFTVPHPGILAGAIRMKVRDRAGNETEKEIRVGDKISAETSTSKSITRTAFDTQSLTLPRPSEPTLTVRNSEIKTVSFEVNEVQQPAWPKLMPQPAIMPEMPLTAELSNQMSSGETKPKAEASTLSDIPLPKPDQIQIEPALLPKMTASGENDLPKLPAMNSTPAVKLDASPLPKSPVLEGNDLPKLPSMPSTPEMKIETPALPKTAVTADNDLPKLPPVQTAKLEIKSTVEDLPKLPALDVHEKPVTPALTKPQPKLDIEIPQNLPDLKGDAIAGPPVLPDSPSDAKTSSSPTQPGKVGEVDLKLPEIPKSIPSALPVAIPSMTQELPKLPEKDFELPKPGDNSREARMLPVDQTSASASPKMGRIPEKMQLKQTIPLLKVTSRNCTLDYTSDVRGDSRADFWITSDEGITWKPLRNEAGLGQGLRITLPGEGTFGIRIRPTGGSQPPVAGELPDCRIEVKLGDAPSLLLPTK